MASIEYSHGFDEKWEWMIMPHLDYNFTQTEQENSLYRLDLLEDMASAPLGSLPSTREALLSTLDISNSYLTDNRLPDSMVAGNASGIAQEYAGHETSAGTDC